MAVCAMHTKSNDMKAHGIAMQDYDSSFKPMNAYEIRWAW